MSEISEKREIELLTLRLLALTAENEILIRNSLGNLNNPAQLKDAKELVQLRAKYTELLAENEELQKQCSMLKTQLTSANEKYRVVIAQVNSYREQLSILQNANIGVKLKRTVKKALNKNSSSEGENK